MPADMTPGVLADQWDVRCDEHRYDRRGLAQAHATNAMNKHNREEHPQPVLDLSKAAALIVARWNDVLEAQAEYGADPDKAWVIGSARGSYANRLEVWTALTGLPDQQALEFAQAVVASGAEVRVHAAPF